MAQRKFGNLISTGHDVGYNRENLITRGKVGAQRVTRATLGDIGNVVTNAQKESNIHTRKTSQKSKGGLSQLTQTIPELNVRPEESTRIFQPLDMENAVDEVSKALENCNIMDIDANDYENPQLCAEYANEIYHYLLSYEKQFIVPDYMKTQKHVNERMRSILVDWLVQVHEKFRLLQETLYLTVSYIDRYLAKVSVPRSELQLVGVTAMLLASKFEEMYAPEIADFVYITDQAYDKQTIRETEGQMCNTLGYQLGDPLCLHFLRRNSKAACATPESHTMAKYFMELMLVDYQCVKFTPSNRAASALWLALKLLYQRDWDATLEYYSHYSEKELKPCACRIAQLVIKANHKDTKLNAVSNKYASHKLLKISQASCLRSDQLFKIAGQW
ncbi:G2/mitotic-specific cyclin-B-like [Xenia sp. Carnegie-2017]|uniref:G2/mitotic-specific cyclin-B-like n=1 Tax=Xenia sp. Carnegie-2017 TaxID=2897299 RepID=UPI001F03DCDA|nr:G2/mitotic-specific cyclin-B-like [Xenia sp. Carnegie-2017]